MGHRTPEVGQRKWQDCFSFEELKAALPGKPIRNEWINIGGQLMPSDEVEIFKEKIRKQKIKSWDAYMTLYRTGRKNTRSRN
jgi:hypothetical protein